MNLYDDMPDTASVNRRVKDGPRIKSFESPSYNYVYDKVSGKFARWGKTEEDDPPYGPSPEIADIEISVNGCPEHCAFCYKANMPTTPTNMTLPTFAKIISKIPKSLTQVALGITGMQANPDLIPIMEHCRSIGIVPNFTLAGSDLTERLATETAKLAGAVAVSARKNNKDLCYETVKLYNALGLKQVNIHVMLSQETEDFANQVMRDTMTDKRLAGLNAVVLLGVKPKGRAKDKFHVLPQEGYDKLIGFCMENQVRMGFDSCSAPKFEKSIDKMDLSQEFKAALRMRSESCESDLFSCYINVKGEFWHCSFSEKEPTFAGVDVLSAEDFVRDVWYSEPVKDFRARSLASMRDGCRNCIAFEEVGRG